MRTTVRLPDDLLRAAKRHAAATGRTLTDVIADALRAALARASRPERGRAAVEVPTYGRLGTQPGVDLDDSAALLDVMEGAK